LGGSRAKTLLFPSIIAILPAVSATVATEQFQPGYVDPRPVLQAAAKAIGTDNLKCVTLSGNAYNGAVRQQQLSRHRSQF
jgi:hypothetical protein